MHPFRRRASSSRARLTARPAAIRAAVVLTLVTIAGAAASPAHAVGNRTFSNTYAETLNGDIAVIGNTNSTCNPAWTPAGSCDTATTPATLNNSTKGDGVLVDVDSDPTTTNSSASTVTLPANATVEYARLTWGSTGNDIDNDGEATVKLDTPTAGLNYQSVAADYATRCGGINAASANRGTACSADVTALVQAGGAGQYTVGGIEQRQPGQPTAVDHWSGWALYIVFKRPGDQLRRIVLSDGFLRVASGVATSPITLNGFTAPATGPVTARLVYAVGEGDAGITGDNATLNSTALDTAFPIDLMNSSNTGHAYQSSRSPSFNNQYGFDVDSQEIDGAIPNGAQSATFTFTTANTNGDTYYPFSTGITIDLAEPKVVLTKSFVDVNGGVVESGDVLEYRVVARNDGDDGATDVTLTDDIPANSTYVPGSLQVTAGANAGAKTDAGGDDQAFYSAGQNRVTFNLGTGATATTGGVLATAAETTIAFRVQLNPNLPENTPVTNTANGAYKGQTAQFSYANPSTIASTPVRRADMVVAQTVAPLIAGQTSDVTLTASNTGGAATHNTPVTLTTTVPAGMSFGAITLATGWTCSTASLPTITCTRSDDLAAGASFPVVRYTVTPSQSATTATFDAAVSGGNETNTANDTDSDTATVGRSADLSLTNTPSTLTANVGDTVTFTVVGRNAGPSTTTGVTITGTIPSGLNPVSATIGGSPCTLTGQNVSCTVGALGAPANAGSIVVTATVLPAAANSTKTFTPSIQGADPDPTPGNNSAGATITIGAAADLALTESSSPSTVNPGSNATYTFTITNNGPNTAAGVSLSDNLPAGVTVQTITPSQGTCGTGDPFTCALGSLASGATATVAVVVRPTLATAGTTLANPGTVTSSTFDTNAANNDATASVTVNPAADLRTTVAVSPTTATVGDTVDYTFTVTNDGPSAATNATLALDFPTGATVVSVTPAQGTCPATGDPRTCALGGLASGASTTVVVRLQLGAGSAGTSAPVAGSAAATQFDPTAGNNDATGTTTVGQAADLRLTQSAAPSPANPGADVTYTLTVQNNGPGSATGVVLTDDLPSGAVVQSITTTKGGCGTGDPFTCNLGTLASGQTETVTVVVRPALSTAGTSLANAGSLTSTSFDPNTANNTASASATVNPATDLRTTVTVDQAMSAVGETRTFLVTVTNDGPSPATGVAAQLDLPNGSTIVSVTPSQGTCGTGDPRTCTIGALASGASATVEVKVTLTAANASGAVTVAAEATGNQFDPTPANNTASASASAGDAADLQLTHTVAPNPANPGTDVTYTVTVKNNGPSTATAVQLVDDLPSGATVQSITTSRGTCGTGDPFTCAIGDLMNGQTATVTIVVRPTLASAGGPLPNSATVSSPIVDQDSSNNTAGATLNVNPAADLRTTATVDDAAATVGATRTYVFTVTNDGPSAATGAELAVDLPAGATILGVTPSQGTCPNAGDPRTCAFGTLPSGSSATVSVQVRIENANAGNAVTASGTASSGVYDPAPGNGTASATTNAGNAADLRITKTADKASANVGDTITWTITAKNFGPDGALGTTVTDAIPAGVTITSATSTVGTCAVGASATTCTVGTLANGADAVITIVGVVQRSAAGSPVGGQASVTGSVFDPDTSNNVSPATSTTVGPAADLRVVTLVDNPNPKPGDTVTWTIQTFNDGPSSAPGVTVTDVVPAGAPITSVSTTGGTCTRNGQTVDCALGTIPAGGSQTVTIVATIPANSPGGSIANTATATSATLDPDPSNNTSSTGGTATGSADLSITLTPDRDAATVGQRITWNGVVGNAGPLTATGVVVTLELPEGMTDVTAETPGGTCTITGRIVTCQVADVPAGQSGGLTISGIVTRDAAEKSLVLTGVAAADQRDPSPADNTTRGGTIAIAAAVDLRLEKSADRTEVTEGQSLTVTSEVSNRGPSTATDVIVVDYLPEGVELQSVVASQGSCVVTGQKITCNLGRLADGEKATISTVVVIRDARAGQKLLSGGSVTSAEFDTNAADNSATAEAVGVRVPDAPAAAAALDLTKTVDKAAPVAGDAVVYTITVTNRGNAIANAVRVVDALPAGLTYKGTKVTGGGVCTRTARTITCVASRLAPGAAMTIKITAVVAEPGKAIENSATVTADGLPSATAGQKASASLKGSGGPFVVAGIKAATGRIQPGSSLRIAVKLTNVGLGTARDSRACFRLPASVVLVKKPAGLTQKGSRFCLSAAALAAGKGKRLVLETRVVGGAGRSKPTITATAANARTKAEAYAFRVQGVQRTRVSGVTG